MAQTTAPITFHYEGTEKTFMGPRFMGTIVDNISIKEKEENTIPGLHIFTHHSVEGYSKKDLWSCVLSYIDQNFERPVRVQIRKPHSVKVVTVK